MKNIISNKDIFTLSQIKGIGNRSLFNIVDSGHSIDNLISLDDDKLGNLIRGSGKKNAIDTIKNDYIGQLEKAELNLEKLKDSKIDLISFWDERYPYLYKSIKNPPVYLYCKGDLSLLNQQSVAIVGTRKCSDYGKKIASRTAKELVSHGFTIVSGLALGIDTAAHEGAIAANGKTISVLVDVHNIYPKENILLSEKILETGGLLFSENMPGTDLLDGLFVARDRLQSGLSLAVFPIETELDGGAMHTAKFAKEQDRLLYCPDLNSISNYPVNSPVASGIFKLVNDGDAEFYTSSSYRELLNALELRKKRLYGKEFNLIRKKLVQGHAAESLHHIVYYMPFGNEDKMTYLILGLKNNNERYVLAWVNTIVKKIDELPEIDVVVRILSSQETSSSGKEPLDIIGKAIAEATDSEYCTTCLTKKRKHKPLKSLNRDERKKELDGIYNFSIKENGKPIRLLIIDDIYTTGTTFREVSFEIRKNYKKDEIIIHLFVIGQNRNIMDKKLLQTEFEYNQNFLSNHEILDSLF